MPGFAFAPVGRLGLSSPPSRPLLRPSLLCSAKTTASPSRVASLCRSLPNTSLVPIQFVSSRLVSRLGTAHSRLALWYTGSPYCSGCSLTRRWRSSRVPRLPLCVHAPLSDSGGVLSACHIASRTHAFRLSKTVGFPQLSLGYPFGPQQCAFRSSIMRPIRSLHLASYTPLRDMHAGSLQAWWLTSSDGT